MKTNPVIDYHGTKFWLNDDQYSKKEFDLVISNSLYQGNLLKKNEIL